ncbi:hypothetical protein OVS_01005 [Mycoplasma ovis str. Michigan]|uniref:Uncharacterized protein n=1 Tax=Mycoplasma ovis str. Michigan TaxID=1415773 RepID=A0ABN4BPA5_9MOLU|nr:hypothetical protein OVS_01005 [Mycoplasma ovis str. Michigan]
MNYLLGNTKTLNTENWQISLPKKVFQTLSDGFTLEPLDSTQHKQRIIFQKDQESSELHSALFQPLWKKWISNWNSKSVGIKKIIFGISADNNLLGKSYEIEQLHKCHNGNWYSIRFNSKLSSQDIEDVDFKHWLNNHLGIL